MKKIKKMKLLGVLLAAVLLAMLGVFAMMASAAEAACDCGTDDGLIHATTCAVYVAPENPVCYCAEKCTEVNEWCDVCGFDYTACTGTDTAVQYDGGAIDLLTLTETYLISDSGEYTFEGSGNYGIKVESGNPTIVLNDASITVGEGSAIDVASGSNATIFVLGDNTIGTTKTESWDALCGGIFVAEGGTVNITSNGTDNILRAHGTLAAAIGGKYDYDNNESYNAGSINISNVTVYAYTNNFYASAIGAAGEGTCGTINITNAVVYVYGAGDKWTSAPGIGNAWSLLDWSDTIPIVIISDSEVHTFRYNPYSDYIGYLGDESGDTYATGSINCGDGGSVKNSTIYCYTGLDATTTDKVVKYGALGGLLKEDGTCEGEHSGGTATCKEQAICGNCGASYGAVDTNNHDSSVKCENGFCPNCDAYEPATDSNSDGYYEIDNAGKLFWYAQAFNAELLEPYSAMLTADIEIPEGMVWTPIGSYDNPYCLTFDGQGYTISGLTVQDGSYVGLFGAANEHATVRNLGVVNSTIAGTDFAGGIVGYNRGVVDNVYVYEVSVSGSGYAGGIAGYHAGTMTDSFAVATVTGAENTGITVGYNAGTAEDVYAFESVEDEALLSGKLAVLLGEGWYQQLGGTGDVHPVLRGYDSVHYYIQDGALCTSDYFLYTNHDQEDGTLLHDQAAEHDENGFCTNVHCGGYEQPAQNADGYYEIDNAGKLYWFMEHVNAGNAAASAILTEDIVVNKDVLVDGALNGNTEGFREWFPIGYHFDRDEDGEAEDVFYIGTFDGNGHTVSGLYFNREIQSYVGLFGQTFTGATVQNVGVIDSYFNGDYYVGGVAGFNNDAVENCYSTGSVSGMAFVGGLVGVNNGSIENCYSTGSVSGRDYVGGVAGYTNGGNVENCYNAGLVSGINYVGGVIGSNDNTTVENCYYLDTCGAAGDGTSVNVERFALGEIAFLLGDAFGQKLGSDSYPVLINSENTNKVYRKGDCATGTATYSNDPAQSSPVEHTFTEESNGFCEVCGGYQAATLTTDKYDLDGDGWDDEVYEISNAGQLYWFAGLVNESNQWADAILTADIVVNEGVLAEMAKDKPNTEGFRAWTPIGVNTDLPYYGIFDGDGHTVSGLYDHRPDDFCSGLFSCIETDAIVQNVGVKDSYFYARGDVGGVVGNNYGTVQNCYNAATVNGMGNIFGGVVGNSSAGTVLNCYNTGDVSGYNYVGGVVGCNDGGTVQNCYNTGLVSGTDYVGGVAGYNYGTVQNCYNVGGVSGTDYVGGVVGNNYGTVQNCYNTGLVSGNNYYVGGVVGYNDGSTVQNCYNVGDVSGSDYVGGIVGFNSSGPVQNCYYLTGTASGGMDGADAAGQAEAKSAAQFASGEVAYLLNGGKTDGSQVWYQTLGEQSYPTLDSEQETVYLGGTCADRQYSNDATVTHDESVAFENGFCPNCDAYEQPDTVEIEGVTYYAIDNAGKLYWFMEHVNAGNTSVNAILTKDIVVNRGVLNALGKVPGSNPFRAWTPIGNNNNQYAGTFDGDGHKVSGLYFSNPEQDYVGLFGYTASDATIQNVGVIDSYFNGNQYVGGVVGYNEGTVQNCYNNGSVSGATQVGGVVGDNYEIVENCYNMGSIIGSDWDVGGVVGRSGFDGTVRNCYNTGSVSGPESVGGVVGVNFGTAETCYNIGTVSGTSNVGGVVGYNYQSTVENCYYLSDTETDEIDGTTAKTWAQFASGEVAYLLNGDQTEIVFGQTLGKDDAPTLGGKQVYELDPTCNADQVKVYSNVYLESFEHAFVNGFCTECDAFQPAVYNEEKGYYEISNAGQLYWFAGLVNGTLTDGTAQNTSANAVLTADIVVNEDVLAESGALNGTGEGFRVWAPIGNGDSQYAGTFDGNGHTVSGLYFNDENQNYVGMFGLLTFGSDVIVQNVGVIDSYFRGDSGVGGVVGYNTGTVQNCYNAGTVTGSSFTGGVIGENSGTVEGSYNTGTVNGSVYAGGVVGYNNGTVENCYNAGAVSGETAVGGVAGYSIVGTVQNSYNTGTVSGNYNVGGVVGYCAGGTMQNCYYLSDTETDEIDGTTAKTWAQFASGEVAFLLGEGFGQEIGKDQLPVLGGTQVYAYTGGTCSAPGTRYTNDAQLSGQEHYEHDKITGFVQTEDGKMVCAVCGREAVAEVVDDFGDKYHFVDLKTALEYAADSGRGYVVLLRDMNEDVQVSEYDELVLDLNGYALAEGITLTLGEGSILTLTNGKVYADMTGQQTSLLILGENVRVYGEINTEGILGLGAPVMGDIDITKVQSIRESNGYQLTVNDLAALQLGLTEGDVIVVDENGHVYFGELKIELVETEGAYTGRAHPISVWVVGIGNASAYNATAYYDGPIIDIGEYELEIELPGQRLVYTADGSDTLTATYTVTKGQLDVNHGPYASHPFGTDRTTAHVRGEMFLLGAAEYTAVPGTFGAVTQNEAGGYEVVFTPDDTDTYEITTVTLEDVHFATEAVLPENVTVIVPDWVGIGEHVTLDHTAVNPHSGEKIENVTYEYYVGELHDAVQWNAIPGNQFTPSASVGDKIYIRVVVPNMDGQYHAVASEPVLVTVVNVADQVADLEQAVDELGDAVASGEASIADINDAMQAVQQRLDALESGGISSDVQEQLDRLNQAIQAIDLSGIEANAAEITALKSTVTELQQTLTALGVKDAELERSLNSLSEELAALAERVEANENAIAELNTAIENLNTLIETKADAAQIAQALDSITARLAALEAIEIPSLDEVNAAIAELDAAIKAIDLSGIEANAAEITALKSAVTELQQTLTALGNKDAELEAAIQATNADLATLQSDLSALAERVEANEKAIAELNAAIENLKNTVAATDDIASINAAMEAVKARLEALEAIEIPSLDAVNAAIAELDAAIKAIDLSGIEANAEAIQAMNATIATLQQTLTTLGNKDAEIEAAIEATSASLVALQSDLSALAERVEANERAIADLNAAIENLNTLIETKADAAQIAQALDSITARLAVLEAIEIPSLDEVNAAIAELDAAIKAIDLSGIEANAAEITALKSTVTELQQTLTAFGVKDAELEAAIEATNATLTDLSGKLADLENRVEANEQAIADLNAAIENLKNTVATTDDIASISSAMEAVKARLAALEAIEIPSLDDVNAAIAELDAAIKAIDLSGIEANAAEITALKSTVTELQQTLTALGVKDAELEAAIQATNADLAVLQSDLSALVERVEANEKAIAELNAAIENLNTLIETKADAAQIAAAIEQITARLAALEAIEIPSLDDVNAAIAELDAAIKAIDLSGIEANAAEITALKSTVTELQQTLTALGVKDAELEAAIEATSASLAALQSDLSALAERVEANEQAIAELNTAIENLNTLIETKADAAQISQALDSITARLAALESAEAPEVDLSEIDAAIAELDAAIKAIDLSGIEANAAEITALKSTVTELQQTLTALGVNDAELEAAIEATNATLTDLSGKLADLENRVEANEKAIAELNTAIENLNTLIAAKADAAQIAQALDSITARLAALEAIEIPSLDEVNAAIAELDAAIKAIDLSGIEANAEAIEAMNATIATLQQTLTALGVKDAELERSLNSLSEELAALAERVEANEKAIAELNTAIENLNTLIETKADAAQIAAAIEQINARLAALEAIEIPSLDAVNAAIAELDEAIKAIDLSGIEANAAEITALKSTVTELQQTLTTLGNKDAELERSLNSLSEELAALAERVEANENAIAELNAAIENLKNTVATTDDIASINAAMEAVKARLEALEAIEIPSLDAVNAAIAELDAAIKAIDLSGIEANAAEITALKSTVTELQQTLTALGNKDAELEAAIQATNADLAVLQSDLSALAERVEANEKAIAELNAAIENLNTLIAAKADAAQIAQALEGINARLAALEAIEIPSLDEVNAVIAELDAAIKAIDLSGIEANAAEITALKSTVTELQQTLTALGNKDAELEAAIEATNATLTDLSGKLADLENRVEANEKAIAELEAAIEELSKIAAGDTTTIAQINQALADVQAALERLEGLESNSRLEAVEAEIPTIQAAVAAINARLDGVNLAQIDANKNAVAELNASVSDMLTALEALGAKDTELAAGIAALQSNLNALEERVEANEQAIAELDAAIELLNALVADKSDIDSINTALALVQTRLEALEKSGVSAKVEQAIASLDEAVAAINEQLAGADLAQIATNKDAVAALNATVTDMQETLNTLGSKDAELAVSIETLRTDLGTLNATVGQIESDIVEINAAIERLNAAIEQLEKVDAKDATALEEAVKALETSIEEAKGLIDQSDDSLKNELDAKIEKADQTLDAAIKTVQENLDEAKQELESRNQELEEKLDGEVKKIQGVVTATAVTAGVAVVADIAALVWFLIRRKRSLL